MASTCLASKRSKFRHDQLRDGSTESVTNSPELKQQPQRQPTSSSSSSAETFTSQRKPNKRRKLRINVRSRTASYDVVEYPENDADAQKIDGTVRDTAACHLLGPGASGPDHWEQMQVADDTSQLSEEPWNETDFPMNWGDDLQELLAEAMLVSEPELLTGRHSNAFVDYSKPNTQVSTDKEDNELQWPKLWEEEGRLQGKTLDLAAVESNLAITPSDPPIPGWLCNAPERGALDFLEAGNEMEGLPALSDWPQESDVEEEQDCLRVPWLPEVSPPTDAEQGNPSPLSAERFDWEWEEDDQEPEIDWVAAFRTQNG